MSVLELDTMKRRPRSTRVSTADLASAYAETGSVYDVAERFGMNGSSVHERLQRHRPGLVKKPVGPWNADLEAKLRADYQRAAGAGELGKLAKRLSVTKTEACRKAGELGLTNQKRRKPWNSVWLHMPEEQAAKVWDTFKTSSLGLVAWCKKNSYDDLGFSRTMKKFFGDEWESVIEAKQPRQSLYRRGRQLEYKVRDHLREVGFFAQRSPASKTPIDILAVRPGEVWMVQCKRGGQLGVAEWNTLIDVARAAGAVPVMASMETGRGSLAYYVLLEKKDGSKRAQPMSRVYPMP